MSRSRIRKDQRRRHKPGKTYWVAFGDSIFNESLQEYGYIHVSVYNDAVSGPFIGAHKHAAVINSGNGELCLAVSSFQAALHWISKYGTIRKADCGEYDWQDYEVCTSGRHYYISKYTLYLCDSDRLEFHDKLIRQYKRHGGKP